jgi:leader peptidase (prepilin peptidase)/N-methyltransferase
MNAGFDVLVGVWLFVVGTAVGSFLNVCIYRIPWQKSVIWPGSVCFRCLGPIAAYDNIPVLSWFVLRGECRRCGSPFSARYAMVELLVGLLFVAVYLTDVILNPRAGFRDPLPYLRMAYHQLFLAFLLVATFIDYDYQIIPDEVTIPGMLAGLAFGAVVPGIRPEPGTATTWLGGLGVGVLGLVVGAGLTWGFRFVFSIVFRREALGFGDVTLMGLIGSFLGWQGAVLAFFLAPFFGFGHAGWKLAKWLGKVIRGSQSSSTDRELAFGPYLSMAAAALMLAWPWLWPHWGRGFFATLAVVFWFLLGW